MKLYILRWNPNISSWTYDQHEYMLQNILENDFGGMNWSIYDFEDLEEGDYWILQQVMFSREKENVYEVIKILLKQNLFAKLYKDSQSPFPVSQKERAIAFSFSSFCNSP